MEANYEKVDRLLELRDDAERRLAGVNRRIATEEKVGPTSCPSADPQALKANGEEIDELQEAEWYLERLDSGLSAIQAADYIIAWICMEDDGVSRRSCFRESRLIPGTRFEPTSRHSYAGKANRSEQSLRCLMVSRAMCRVRA